MKQKFDIHVVLALFAAGAAFILLVLLFFVPLPHDNKDLFNVLATAFFTGCVIGAYNFFFGNSKKQVDPNAKTTTITEQTTIPEVPAADNQTPQP